MARGRADRRAVTAMGIDLSGRSTGVTAAALLADTDADRPALAALRSRGLRGDHGDRRLRELAAAWRPGVVAIDAPLSLPHAVTCADPGCERCFPDGDAPAPSYGSRAVDARAAWTACGHLAKEPMPTAMIAALAFRGIYLRRVLARAGVPTIETWPMGVYRALEAATGEPPTGAAGTDDVWRRGVLTAAVGGLPERASRDELDAIAAAYAGWCWLAGRAEAVRGPDPGATEGEIWVPA